jgi:hypothetical protein
MMAVNLRSLSLPDRRDELIVELKELAVSDPRVVWRAETQKGMVSGIDEVFHFFFDDYDFGPNAIGQTLLSQSEVAAVQNVKSALEAILERVRDQGDDAFVEHPLWPQVTAAASNALRQLATQP